ncbi:NAD(P)/FAD-dependent oxidoreductase [Streptomyces bambusae]|uniref:NAD(P)/FAD-dependent oxidoreductase n=1 Tax=Streptomyces bambusae TaxID=1550616 RepID=UPI001CFDBB16|nr:NAD(P)/FAD-dependent oxidoreductase [Streptomyces bambusae]MCB5163959.1 NAD(P)/FAD-dependent oxidoreductase [Streptomyces bambusae]
MTGPQSAGYDYDVVISGASLAGSAAATLLARRGVRVALLERRSDPDAYKVLCTHSVQPSAYPVLVELGLGPALEAAGVVRNGSRWYTRWGWIEPKAEPTGPELPWALNIRRSVLDPMIRSRAAETAGVDLLLGHRVTGLLREAGRTVGVRASTPQGEREIRARLVVGADGRDSPVAKYAGVPGRTHENSRFAYLAHFRGLPLPGDLTHTWFLEPDMGYAFPNDDGVTVIGVVPGKERLPAFREDLEGSFFSFVRALPEAPDIDSAEQVTKITGFVDYPFHSRKPTAPGLALTGDPLWGVGCGWALQTAQWLAEAVAPAATGRGDLDKALKAYARRHQRTLLPHQHIAVDFARARPFNRMEQLMFSAATRDAALARHMHRFAGRFIGPLRFLNPAAVTRASTVNLKHRLAQRS